MTESDIIYPKIYPKIQQDSQILIGDNFRLHKINMVLSQLGSEHKHYEHVRKKYTRTRSFFNGAAISCGSLSAILTASGIATSLTPPGVIIGLPLRAVGALLGLVSGVCGLTTKKLTKKISKHEKTIQLIKSKENSINDLVSKALHNNSIDEKEFTLIMSELEKYEKLKASIRRKRNLKFIKEENVDIDKIKEDLKKEILERLKK